MCGISVIVFSAEARSSPEAIAAMTAALHHRGPDAQTCVQLEGAHLGHTRLSIIDLASGQQPMTEEQERYWIVFNGEIYNYRELRQDLEQQGWRFRTQSDTEVLLRAYQQYGDRVPTYLNGQFAFAIWDQQDRRLFAARDRLGEKPLYWAYSDQGHLLLASELKALLAPGLIRPRIDRGSVDAYLTLLYIPPDRTIYDNVQVLRPGQALSWQAGQMQQWAYWQPHYGQAEALSPAEIRERLQVLVTQAVKRQLVADVPIGAFLSGGLDSSTIVALMAQQTATPVVTFAVGFGDLINELPYARMVAQQYQTNHHELQMELPIGELLQELNQVYDEPLGDSSNLPTYCIAKFARERVKVVLSGDGGDELFGGYDWYSYLWGDRPQATSAWSLQLQAWFWRVAVKLGLPYRQQRDGAVKNWVRRSLQQRYPELWHRHLAFVSQSNGISAHDRALLWDQPPLPTEASLEEAYYSTAVPAGLDRATDFDLRCYLPGDILVKVDRAAMAHGLETRAPFLDVDLVDFVLSLPSSLRFSSDRSKPLLHDACQHLWPEPIRQRAKQGFGAPLQNWVKRSDVQSLWHRVCQPDSPLSALLPGLSRCANALRPQDQWSLLCLGLWLEHRSACLNTL